tara:strand:+ start:108 stop:209 length:102 start_codon:yes stop_codon:yes gene_type:complete
MEAVLILVFIVGGTLICTALADWLVRIYERKKG